MRETGPVVDMDAETETDEAGVRGLEERAFNAWPALQTIVADGWLLRFAEGYTKRANSLNAWRPAVPVGDVLPRARELYSARGLPLVVRVTPLAGPETDTALAAAGLALVDETLVMTAPIAPGMTPDDAVAIATRPEPAWSDGFAAANAVSLDRRGIHDRMLAAIPPPAAFATAQLDTRPAGWGVAVIERDFIGLFDIATAPDARRHGVATRLVAALLAWGAAAGARTAYLQVAAANAPAIALYRRLGFRERYRYHYRIVPR